MSTPDGGFLEWSSTDH